MTPPQKFLGIYHYRRFSLTKFPLIFPPLGKQAPGGWLKRVKPGYFELYNLAISLRVTYFPTTLICNTFPEMIILEGYPAVSKRLFLREAGVKQVARQSNPPVSQGNRGKFVTSWIEDQIGRRMLGYSVSHLTSISTALATTRYR